MSERLHPLDRLDVSPRVLKRAQYEALAFFMRPPYVEVRNYSYPDPENHTYNVRIADGVPIRCSCPADVEYERACKHRVGVAIRTQIIEKALKAQVAADGGGVANRRAAGSGDDEARSTAGDETADCACRPDSHRPCWSCVRADRRTSTDTDGAGEQR
jgi:hypothetical protein